MDEPKAVPIFDSVSVAGKNSHGEEKVNQECCYMNLEFLKDDTQLEA
jgi:hypothetical protein